MVTESLKKWLYLGISAIKMVSLKTPTIKSGTAFFDPSVSTDNLGDYIIMRFCRKAFTPLMNGKQALIIPTHSVPEFKTLEKLGKCDEKIVCGTNLLFPELEHASIWKLPATIENYQNCILMGVGWGYYSNRTSFYTRICYHMILDKKRLHAVRDRYTWNKLREIGIHNVLYTGCPTMWNLTPEFCKSIPQEKGRCVVATLTEYEADESADSFMLKILCSNYERVYMWPQGKNDEKYILSLVNGKDNIHLLDRSMEAFEEILKEPSIDYVGTRLHAGIMAVNAGKRTLIIATDSRAKEIGKDTNLPVIYREKVKETLENKIGEKFEIKIDMPFKNIEMWKQQFVS